MNFVMILDTLRMLGIDPGAMIASLLVYLVVREGIPLGKLLVRKVSDYFLQTPNKLDDMALPILDALDTKLGMIDSTDATISTVANLVAASILETASNPKDAKLAAGELAAKILAELKKQAKLPKSE